MATSGRPRRDELAIVRAAAEHWDREANDVGFLARVFAQTALPYKNPGNELPAWGRRNGDLTLTVQPGYVIDGNGAPVPIGYPYGTVPRLLLIWMSTEAVRTGDPTPPLADSLSDFMRQIGLIVSGGANGNIRKLREQMSRLLNARISVHYRESEPGGVHRDSGRMLNIASQYDLWWSDRVPDQPSLIPSYVTLSPDFFKEVTQRPVPLDFDTLGALRGSAMRLDIYAWLTYRLSYLKTPSRITWDQLMFQFGGSGTTRSARHKFRSDFAKHLAEVTTHYNQARTSVSEHGIILYPSPPHVSRGNRPALNR